MDTSQALAVTFVFVSNVLVIAGLAWVIHHVHQSTELMQARLTAATQDLAETGRGLCGLGSGVDRLIERMASAERQSSAMLRVTADTLSDMDGQLRQSLQATLTDLAASGELVDPQLHQDLRRLLDSLSHVTPGGAGTWADNHRQELEQVMAQSETLMSENARLVSRMGDLREQIDGLRSVQRAQQAADLEIESLQSALSGQQQLAVRLRNEAREASHRAGAAEAATEQVRAEGELAREDAAKQAQLALQAAERARELEDELAELRHAHERLQADHARQQEQMQRLAVEKEFIEDKFLGLDANEPETA